MDLVHLKDLNGSLVCFTKDLQDPFLGPINILEVGPGEVSTYGAEHVALQVTNKQCELLIFEAYHLKITN